MTWTELFGEITYEAHGEGVGRMDFTFPDFRKLRLDDYKTAATFYLWMQESLVAQFRHMGEAIQRDDTQIPMHEYMKWQALGRYLGDVMDYLCAFDMDALNVALVALTTEITGVTPGGILVPTGQGFTA